MEAERLAFLDHIGSVGIDRKKIRELAAEQLAGLALEVFGKLPRHVGQGSERIGLPEPAAPAVFELVDEPKRLASGGVEPEARPARDEYLLRPGDAVGDQHDAHDLDADRNDRRAG